MARPPRASCCQRQRLTRATRKERPLALTYDTQARPARLPRQCKLVGTRHEGPEWTHTVRALRAATRKAADKASWRPDATPDSVGLSIIDHLDELDHRSLHVLALVNSILFRQSRR